MAKRSKLNPDIGQVLLELTEENADRAPWLDKDGPEAPWYDALAKIDKDEARDTEELRDLLQSDQELSPAVRYHIADLLKRYTLKRKPGNQRTPSYVLSSPNIRLWYLIYFMEGRDSDVSVEQSAEELETDEFPKETLIAAFNGRHGGFARAIKGAKK